MNDTIYQPQAKRHINWGGVLKGVAIVAAVAAVAVVGIWAATALSAYVTSAIAANATASALVQGAVTGTETAIATTSEGIGWLVGTAGLEISKLTASLGLTGSFTQAAAVNHTMGIIGGAAATAVATHAAIPYLQHTDFVDVGHSIHPETSVLTTQAVLPMHDLSHMSHHAAEHADEHAAMNWAQRVALAPRITSYTTFADTTRAAKEERRSAPPSESFTEQLNTARADLDQVLSK